MMMNYPKLIVVNGIHYEEFPVTEKGVETAQEYVNKERGKVFLVEEYERRVSDGSKELTLQSRRIN